MGIDDVGRILIIFGVVLLVAGLAIVLLGKVGVAGRLPGDIFFQRGNVSFYFPLVTMLVVSIVLTVIVNVVLRLFK